MKPSYRLHMCMFFGIIFKTKTICKIKFFFNGFWNKILFGSEVYVYGCTYSKMIQECTLAHNNVAIYRDKSLKDEDNLSWNLYIQTASFRQSFMEFLRTLDYGWGLNSI